MKITQITEQDRITMALEGATEAIKTLSRKLDIAVETLLWYADSDIAAYMAIETLQRLENEQ